MHFIRIENAKRDRSMIKLIVFTERKDEFIISNEVFFFTTSSDSVFRY